MTSPQQYTPRDLSALDILQSSKRTADAILRNNPLTNARISHGLMVWVGNHVKTGSSDKVEFFWVGDFLPADTTMGGIPQKGVVMFRDDATGGQYAWALYDHDPGGGGLGLRQTIHLRSGDGKRMHTEARHGGMQWPQSDIYMGATGLILEWPSTDQGTFQTLSEGRVSVIGNHVVARYWAATSGGATGEWRVRVEGPSGDIIGPLRTLGVNANTAFEDQLDVSIGRGDTFPIRLEARVTNGTGPTGRARCAPISFRCYTNDT